MLGVVAGLVGCGPEPTPVVPTPPAVIKPPSNRTPFPTVTLKQLRPNALVGTRASELAEPLKAVVDGTYCNQAWRDTTFPSTITIPAGPVKGDLLLEWNSSGTSDYISAADAPTYGIPASYTISTSSDSTNGQDGTWREVVNVKDNTARTREHRFPFAGARWLRMTVTSAVPGPLGNTFAIDEIDLHDASQGTDDSVFFLGDSITAEAYTRCPANGPSFAQLAHQADAARFPAMIDGGVGGVNSGYGVSVIKDWLALNPDFHVWAIGYGTNDAWQKVSPADFEANLETIVQQVASAGRIPVIARIPFATKGPDDADVQALNDVIDRVTEAYGLPKGPDLYAWFSAHRDELSPDGVHPGEAGIESINRLWYEALRRLYSSKP